MKARFVVISAIAVILVVGLYGIDINDDPAPTTYDQPLKRSDHTIVKSETLSVVTGVHSVDPQNMQSSFERHDIPADEPKTDEHAFSLVQNADAISAEQTDINITSYDIGFRGQAFASNGDVYGGYHNRIYRADISEGVKTTWIIPNGRTAFGSGDVDSSGSYYFASGGQLYRTNPADNSFTTWSGIQLVGNTIFVDSHDDVWFESRYGNYRIGNWWQSIDSINILQGNSQMNVLVTGIRTDADTDYDDQYHDCRNMCEEDEDVCSQPCDYAYGQCLEGIDRCYEMHDACTQQCDEEEELCFDSCKDKHPRTIDEGDTVNKLIRFSATGVSFPATVELLDPTENVLYTGALYPNRNAQIQGHFLLPTNITSGTYNETSHTWNIPTGNYNTTGTYKINIHDSSRTVHTTFNLDPDIITPTPALGPPSEPVPPLPGEPRYYTNPHHQFISKLDPETNTITRFYAPSFANADLIAMDSSDSLYFKQNNAITKFTSGSDEITRWRLPATVPHMIGTSDQKIYTITEDRTPVSLEGFWKLSELDTQTSILREWIMPKEGWGNWRFQPPITVDDQENVFFGGYDRDKHAYTINRFVPSTETFTSFDSHPVEFLKAGTDGAIYWYYSDSAGIIR